ncbi:LOW QUALITY PROTEIN: tRNA wybutosine-synthesizing protein 2 homolog [Amphiura filiformis]|uniref:LOW QUALITY PROTEIN: tRNA wybutosine-synthesizing protein 2 homolog n=1 Tax=Amphiura filiformis TaxID=82378 RepID=UPI003B20B6F3
MNDQLRSSPCVCVEAQFAQKMRQHLELQGIWDARYRLTKLSNDTNEVAVPIQEEMLGVIQHEVEETGVLCSIPCRLLSKVNLPQSKKMTIVSPRQKLVRNIKSLIEGAGMTWIQDLEDDIPRQWEMHGDMVLLPDASFKHATWAKIESKCLWETVATSVCATRVAKKGVVQNNDFRSPQVHLLLGDTGWVEQIDNGIRYTYDIQHCMFSSGNITEKLRVASLNCDGETVVDLYAGIGYFTLPYLVHAKAAMVHACEWNPHAVRALEKNLQLNNVRERCVIHAGDNSKVCPKGIADRVNLGLIPSSQQGWPIACAALKHTGGILHIHGNVTTTPLKSVEDSLLQNFEADKLATADCGGKDCKVDSKMLKSFRQTFMESDIRSVAKDELMHVNDTAEQTNISDKHIDTSNLSEQNDTFNKTDLKDSSEDNRTVQDHNIASFSNEAARENNAISSHTHNASGADVRTQWNHWAKYVGKVIQRILTEMHDGKDWSVCVIHVEHVKSYAPRVDHIVADLECRPKS